VRSKRNKGAYAQAGVDITAADKTKDLIGAIVRRTFGVEVLSGIGHFGAFFKLGGYSEPVLVASTDGVGTKLKIAVQLDRHDSVGVDLVNHCVNDILCCGARPLFMLDYIAMGKLMPHKVAAIVEGLSGACSEVGCALIGGETAEMPGIYKTADYDLAGFIVGAVERSGIITGEKVVEGDVVVGLLSSGLHTNGYSLVRKIFGIDRDSLTLKVFYPELGMTLGEALLIPHRCYYNDLKPFLTEVHGLAHITGGGFAGNIPRILPAGLSIQIKRITWQIPPIFELIQNRGGVGEQEMFRVFNMGIGMVVICDRKIADHILAALPIAREIGNVVKTCGRNRVIID